MGNNIFVNENEQVKIEIAIGYSKNGNIYCELSKDKKEIINFLGDDLDGQVIDYNIFVKKPSFKDMTDISKDMISVDVNQGINLNIAIMRMQKMKKLIIDWDFTGEDGKKILVTDKAIEKLNPSIANLIGEQIDEITS